MVVRNGAGGVGWSEVGAASSPFAHSSQDCHMEEHADYDGPALTWGLTYKKASAAQCCQACREVRGAGRRVSGSGWGRRRLGRTAAA